MAADLVQLVKASKTQILASQEGRKYFSEVEGYLTDIPARVEASMMNAVVRPYLLAGAGLIQRMADAEEEGNSAAGAHYRGQLGRICGVLVARFNSLPIVQDLLKVCAQVEPPVEIIGMDVDQEEEEHAEEERVLLFDPDAENMFNFYFVEECDERVGKLLAEIEQLKKPLDYLHRLRTLATMELNALQSGREDMQSHPQSLRFLSVLEKIMAATAPEAMMPAWYEEVIREHEDKEAKAEEELWRQQHPSHKGPRTAGGRGGGVNETTVLQYLQAHPQFVEKHSSYFHFEEEDLYEETEPVAKEPAAPVKGAAAQMARGGGGPLNPSDPQQAAGEGEGGAGGGGRLPPSSSSDEDLSSLSASSSGEDRSPEAEARRKARRAKVRKIIERKKARKANHRMYTPASDAVSGPDGAGTQQQPQESEQQPPLSGAPPSAAAAAALAAFGGKAGASAGGIAGALRTAALVGQAASAWKKSTKRILKIRTADVEDESSSRRQQQRQIMMKLAKMDYSKVESTELMRMIVESAKTLLRSDRCAMFIIDEENQELFTTINGNQELRIPIKAGIAGHVAVTGATLNIPEAYDDPRFNREVDLKTGYRTKTILCMPILSPEGKNVAVAQLINKIGGVFDKEDEEIFEEFAVYCGIALCNAQFYEKTVKSEQFSKMALAEAKKLYRQNKMLLRLAKTVNNELEITSLTSKIIDLGKELVNADRCTLFLVDEARQELFFTLNPGTDSAQEIRFPMSAGIAGHVATTGQKLNIKDAYLDLRFNRDVDLRTGYKTNTILCMPIHSDTRIVGVAQLINKVGGFFTREDEALFTEFAVYCGIGISNSMLYEKAKGAEAESYRALAETKRLSAKNETLLKLASSLGSALDLDEVIRNIMAEGKQLIQADRCTIFMVDHVREQLYSEWIEPGKEIRIAMSSGIAGHVASTGEPLNIKNPYKDKRFNREVDSKTGYKTESILCMPIFEKTKELPKGDGDDDGGGGGGGGGGSGGGGGGGHGEDGGDGGDTVVGEDGLPILKSGKKDFRRGRKVLGVAQLVNKISGTGKFNQDDEETFEAFGAFAGLAIHNAHLYRNVTAAQVQLQLNLELVSTHANATDEEFKQLNQRPRPSAERISQLRSFDANVHEMDWLDHVRFISEYFVDLGLITAMDVPLDVVRRMVLTVRKNYRPGEQFHNFDLAAVRTHCMFVYLAKTRAAQYMKPAEQMVLLMAALMNDIEYSGIDSHFQTDTEFALAPVLSGTSVSKRHHLDRIITILSNERCMVFRSLGPKEYRETMRLLEKYLYFTDLTGAAGRLQRFAELLEGEEKAFNPEFSEHRDLLAATMMTCASFSWLVKPFEHTHYWSDRVIKDFFAQPASKTGDLKSSQLPSLILDVIKKFVEPSYVNLSKVLPEMKPQITTLEKVGRMFAGGR